MGDRKLIRIWKDNWIPNAINTQPISIKPANCILTKVNELIDLQRLCWEKQLVEQLFQPQEAKQILRIPVYHYGVKDQLVWNMDKKGLFTIKSAYVLACSTRKGPAL